MKWAFTIKNNFIFYFQKNKYALLCMTWFYGFSGTGRCPSLRKIDYILFIANTSYLWLLANLPILYLTVIQTKFHFYNLYIESLLDLVRKPICERLVERGFRRIFFFFFFFSSLLPIHVQRYSPLFSYPKTLIYVDFPIKLAKSP